MNCESLGTKSKTCSIRVQPNRYYLRQHLTLRNQRVVGFSHYFLRDVVYIYLYFSPLCITAGGVLFFLPPNFVFLLFTQRGLIVKYTVLPSSCAFLHESHFYATQNAFEN